MTSRKPHSARIHPSTARIARGFTLIEILIAILILGTVVTTIYAAYTGTFHIAKTTDEDDDLYAAARIFFLRLAKDMGGLVPYREGYEFVAKQYEYKGRTYTTVAFSSLAHLAFSAEAPSGGVAWISYDLVEDKKDGEHKLVRQDLLIDETLRSVTPLMMSSEAEWRHKAFVLCDRIQSLAYTFYDAEGKEYDSWDTGSDLPGQKKRAPAMVWVRLELVNPRDKERPLRYMTRIVIPVSKVYREGTPS